jgi:hypothetical protein
VLRLCEARGGKIVRYALATGSGFGSRRSAYGRAIYVYHPRTTEVDILAARTVPETKLQRADEEGAYD